MMMKLQKRNMNKELEVVLLTSSITESIIFFNQKIQREERKREIEKEEERLFVRKRRLERGLN